MRINQETSLAKSDPQFIEQLRRGLFETDFAHSREMTKAQPVSWGDYISEFITNQL